MQMKIDLNDGKYTYIFDNGKQKALRHGEEWRDLTGDNLIYWMACRIQELEEELQKHTNHLDMLPCGWESFEENCGE